MKIAEAAALIRNPFLNSPHPQSWCDLGCGSGTFTLALAQLLAPGSTIYSVDSDPDALGRVPTDVEGVKVHKVQGDLRNPQLPLPAVAGFLMANVLHFIPDQTLLLKRLVHKATALLIVEYDRTNPNPWGPYPVPFEKLRSLLIDSGAKRIERLATRRSRFAGTIYSALAESSAKKPSSFSQGTSSPSS